MRSVVHPSRLRRCTLFHALNLHRAIGLSASDLIARLLGDGRDGDEALAAAHDTLYGTWFDRLPALDGAQDLLRTLVDRGRLVVLAASVGGCETQGSMPGSRRG